MRCSRIWDGSHPFAVANSVMYRSKLANFGVANGRPNVNQKSPTHRAKGRGMPPRTL